MDGIIVAIIMIAMILCGVGGAVYATKKGNPGFVGSVKYKEKKAKEKEKLGR